ncbi:MAG TPA: hypothetical protein VFL91_30505 [Thermomicrobiales bacterium]|nr:hypothetical protein [Thermomicrobiales bacterium]
MAQRDRYRLPLSTASGAAVEHYVRGVDLLLSGNLGAEEGLRQAVAADEGLAVAQATLAALDLRAGRHEEARSRLAAAEAGARGATRRERQHVAVLAETALGSPARALALAEEHLDAFPSDAYILRQYTSLRLGGGCRGMKAAILDRVQRLAPAYGDDWYYTGTLAFYLHEVDRLAESRRYAERSLAGNPRNGNAAHSLAHCFYESAEYAGGLDFLDGWLAAYDPDAPNACHLQWHQALFELARGRYRRAYAIYRESIRPSVLRRENGTMGPPLADAASLFWRCLLYGEAADHDTAWREIAAFARAVAAAPPDAFNDAHCAMAFAAAGDEAALAALIDRLQTAAGRGDALAGEVVLPLVLGVAAFARGDHEETVRRLAPLAGDLLGGELSRIPGSRAQRRVFEETLLRAFLLTGRHAAAEAMLRARLEHQHAGRDLFWLADAAAARGLPDAAADYRAQGRAAWPLADPDAPELRRAALDA